MAKSNKSIERIESMDVTVVKIRQLRRRIKDLQAQQKVCRTRWIEKDLVINMIKTEIQKLKELKGGKIK